MKHPNNSVSFTVEIPGKPRLMNQARAAKHWSENSKRTEEDRKVAKLLAKSQRIPSLDAADFEIIHHVKKSNRGRKPDVAACCPAVKAHIDGFVDAGVLKDDGPNQMLGILFKPICICEKDSLEIIINERKVNE